MDRLPQRNAHCQHQVLAPTLSVEYRPPTPSLHVSVANYGKRVGEEGEGNSASVKLPGSREVLSKCVRVCVRVCVCVCVCVCVWWSVCVSVCVPVCL